MRITVLGLLLLPTLATAQQFEFQLQPEAFPVEISGWQPCCPWAGGLDAITPKLADLNADGVLDFYCGDSRGYISHFQNLGSATAPSFLFDTFFYDSMYSWNYDWGHTDLDLVDINADGKLDAFVGGGLILLYPNLGTATQPNHFGQPDTVRETSGQYIIGTRIALADIDGDGKVDLFTGPYYAGGLSYYHNVGTPQNYAFQQVSTNWFNTYSSEGILDPCFGDLDGDGDLDLLVGTGEGTVYYYRNDGDSANAQMTYVTNNFCGIDVEEDASPELADIDGDGDLDLFVGRAPNYDWSTAQGDVFFYENIGTPQEANFQFATSNYLTWDCGYSATPRLVDIDADGLPDLLSHIGSRLLYYHNEGSLSGPVFVYQSDNYAGINVFDLMPWFVDLDADGDYDLLAGTSAIPGPPGLKLYINQGTPQNPNFVLYSDDLVPGVFTQNSVLLAPSTADIDGDGDQDLFVSDNDSFFTFSKM